MTEAFLSNLDNLLSEFYSVSSDNSRKAQIEQNLQNLKNSENCWECCIQLLQQSQSQYSQWWALSTLEDYVSRKWGRISPSDGANMREFLQKGAMRPNQIQFITVKYVKVFVNVGIRQWENDDSFFQQIMQLVTGNVEGSACIGISMLLVLSEELNRPRFDISPDQLATSKEKLNQQLTPILATLTDLLDKLVGGTGNSTLGCGVLQCLAHLLSWISLTEVLTPGLVATVFKFAKKGMEGESDLGTHAMSCINEIVGRNLVPRHIEDFILQLFQQTLQLLKIITKRDINSLETPYHKKLIEFLNLFTSSHLRRIESNASFPVLDFLSLLFEFADAQTDPDMYCGTVEVCGSWVDFLLSVHGSLSPDGAVPRYGEALVTLANLLLRKVRYNTNPDMLDEVEDTEGDLAEGEIHTDWDVFLGKHTQLISKIMDLHPLRTSRLLISLYNEHCDAFYQLHASVDTSSESEVRVTGVPIDNFYRHLRDVSTVSLLCQLTLPSLLGERFQTHTQTAQGILFHAMKCVQIATGVCGKYGASSALVAGYARVLQSSVCVLSTFTQWFAAFGNQLKGDQQYSAMITAVLEAVLSAFSDRLPVRVQQSVVELFLSVVVVCRPSCLLSVPSVQRLYNSTAGGAYMAFPTTVLATLHKAVTLGMVLPWQHVTDQQWEVRAGHFEQFVTGMFSKVLQIDVSAVSTSLPQHAPVLTYYLTALTTMVESVGHRETRSKQLVCGALLPLVRHLIALLPHLQRDSRVFEHVLSFTTALCDALRVQLGSQFLGELVGCCLENFTKSKAGGSDVARTTVEKFVELLTTVIREPSNAFKSFTPDILTMSLGEIRECAERTESLAPPYFSLLHSILDYSWNYFYPRNAADREACSNQEQFLAILQLFGASLLKTDFNLIKQNATALSDLNDKHELFRKSVFVSNLKPSFMTAILHILLSGSAPIIDEDLEEILFLLACGTTEHTAGQVYLQTLSNYLSSVLLQEEVASVVGRVETTTNAVSFRINLRKIANEVKFHVSCRV